MKKSLRYIGGGSFVSISFKSSSDRKSTVLNSTSKETVLYEGSLTPIDIDDTLAYNSDQSFALLLHGNQSKESGLQPQVIKNRKFMSKYDKYKKKNR